MTMTPSSLSTAMAQAARAIPRAGSVTQSSSTADGITVDTIDIERQTRESGGHDYVVRRTGSDGSAAWVVNSATEENVTRSNDLVRVEQTHSGGKRTVTAINLAPGGETSFFGAGVWLEEPNGGAPIIGAFADHESPFPTPNVQALTGTAEYYGEGGAYGLFLDTNPEERTSNELGNFRGNVSLRADFGNSSTGGSISGRVTLTRVRDQPVDNTTLTLEAAPITNADSGFFTGDVKVSVSGNVRERVTENTGKWGGQFVGGATGDSGHPLGVMGTFGGQVDFTNPGGTGRVVYVGAFGATQGAAPSAPSSPSSP